MCRLEQQLRINNAFGAACTSRAGIKRQISQTMDNAATDNATVASTPATAEEIDPRVASMRIESSVVVTTQDDQIVPEQHSPAPASSSSTDSPADAAVGRNSEILTLRAENAAEKPSTDTEATNQLPDTAVVVEPVRSKDPSEDNPLPGAITEDDVPNNEEVEAKCTQSEENASEPRGDPEIKVEQPPAVVQSPTKARDASVSQQTLVTVQEFLISKVADNQCSNTKEIIQYVEQYLDEKQQTRYCPVLLQRVSDHFTRAASARGEEEVSLEIQSSICMLDAMFQTLGRKTPLQDIYTAEEEEMLDQLVLGQLSHEGTPRNDAIPQ